MCTHVFPLMLTFKVLRRARTRCSLSFSRGSLALWVKQRRSSCRLQGLGSPRAVMLACSRARYSCSSPSRDSCSRPSDGRRSLPSETLLSRLSTLNSRMSGRPTGAEELQLLKEGGKHRSSCPLKHEVDIYSRWDSSFYTKKEEKLHCKVVNYTVHISALAPLTIHAVASVSSNLVGSGRKWFKIFKMIRT